MGPMAFLVAICIVMVATDETAIGWLTNKNMGKIKNNENRNWAQKYQY